MPLNAEKLRKDARWNRVEGMSNHADALDYLATLADENAELLKRIEVLEQRGREVDADGRLRFPTRADLPKPTPAAASGSASVRATSTRLYSIAGRKHLTINESVSLQAAAVLLEQLAEDRERLEEAVQVADLAMQAWIHQYAPQECYEAEVADHRKRIREAGGTVAYIAHVTATLRAARKAKVSGDSATSQRHEDASKGES